MMSEVEMSDDDRLRHLISALSAASSFEEAANVLLRTALETVQSNLAGSADTAEGRLLRGILYLRPLDGYQRLVGIEFSSGEPTGSTAYLTSATAWRWIVEHQTQVSIDVHRGALLAWSGDHPTVLRDDQGLQEAPGQRTRDSLLNRQVTHVHVVPLLLPGDGVRGAFSLEMVCRQAIGHEAFWAPCIVGLDRLTAVASPYIIALPSRSVATTQPDQFLPVVGKATARLTEMLRVFAQQEETILLSGPTGVGKSRLAFWCHARSTRREQPFEVVDLLSIPEELQMAELFGWKRGAFTGAVKDTTGALGRAEGGTLFIDEIDKLSLKAQSGLLRVLEERRYRPLGDNAGARQANVRFLIGTNADLWSAVRVGRFREDLYYRISVLPIQIPPLAERLDEIAGWARYMANRHHREKGAPGQVAFELAGLELLEVADWPGNLRQLDNVIRRAYTIAIANAGQGTCEITIGKEHVAQALGKEASHCESALLTELWRAAEVFAREAERRYRLGDSLSLDLTDSFRGMVLAATIRRHGSSDETFAILSQSHLLKNRNQYRVIHRELERVRDLVNIVGGTCGELNDVLKKNARQA
jgi:DNA-binding NtrC family response regulator